MHNIISLSRKIIVSSQLFLIIRLCGAHKHSRAKHTLLGKPYIRVRQRGCDDDTTPLNRRSNSCLRSPHRKQPKASVYAGDPSAEHLNIDRDRREHLIERETIDFM